MTKMLELNKIYCGDCLEYMREMPDKCVDLVLTDPPYSSGTRKEGSKGLRKSMLRGTDDKEWFQGDCLTTNGFVWLMRECALEWRRILKPGGSILCFIDWRMYPALSGAIESADLRHQGLIVWDKTFFGMGTHFRNQHELILHFTHTIATEAQRHDIGNVIRCPPIRNGDHPNEKPEELLETLLSVVCPKDGVILDPFMGSGSTVVAACKSGRNYIGIEKEPAYIEIALKRLEKVNNHKITDFFGVDE